MIQKKDNSNSFHKSIIRQRIAKLINEHSRILECFCGNGKMFKNAWYPFSGIAIDKDNNKVLSQTLIRKKWTVVCGDANRIIQSKLVTFKSFDVVDIDPYGEPWPTVKNFFSVDRKLSKQWWLILTDGYWPQMNMGSTSKTLFSKNEKISGISNEVYIDLCFDFVSNLLGDKGFIVGSLSQRASNHNQGVGQHVFLIQDSEKETPELEALRSW